MKFNYKYTNTTIKEHITHLYKRSNIFYILSSEKFAKFLQKNAQLFDLDEWRTDTVEFGAHGYTEVGALLFYLGGLKGTTKKKIRRRRKKHNTHM